MRAHNPTLMMCSSDPPAVLTLEGAQRFIDVTLGTAHSNNINRQHVYLVTQFINSAAQLINFVAQFRNPNRLGF